MGLTLSREAAAQSPASPTHNDTGDMASVLSNTAITNVTPTTTIKRTSPSKSLQNNWKTPQQQQNHHVRQASVRSRAALPIPDHSELDKRFAKVLVRFFFFLFIDFNRSLFFLPWKLITNWLKIYISMNMSCHMSIDF